MPKLVGLIMGKEYREAMREQERKSEAHRAAWEAKEAIRLEEKAAREEMEMEKAQEINRIFREKVKGKNGERKG